MKKILLFTSILAIAACSKKINSIAPSEASVAMSPEMAAGKEAYEKYCDSCHGLKNPASESAAEWREIVPEMANMSKSRKGIAIDEQTQQQMIAYLVANARK